MNLTFNKRHKTIFFLYYFIYQRKINSQMKKKMAAIWALCKVWLTSGVIYHLQIGENYKKTINIENWMKDEQRWIFSGILR